MRIFLVGYMGCGKSRWGKIIAEHYQYRFVDLDTLIEERENASISKLFEMHGESGFRSCESSALHSVADEENIVISTGGGAPCFHDNMNEMNRLGLTLYIEATPELLRERITNSKTERPLVKSLSHDELLKYIGKHLKSRLPFYHLAKCKLTSGNLELSDFLEVIDPFINQ